MRSVIVCEGTDDLEIIADYLENKGQWEKCLNNRNLQRDFELPQIDFIRGKSYAEYEHNTDRLVIWSVGGKDSFEEAYKYLGVQISAISSPDIDQILFFLDRDEDDIATVLNKVQADIDGKILQAQNESPDNEIQISTLENAKQAKINFKILGEDYLIYVVPLIIPFDRNGALEDMLMQAIQAKTEGAYIIGQGTSYIQNMAENEAIREEYFKNKARLQKKALFSAIMSVVSPTHSRKTYNEILKSVAWYNDETICEHFNAFDSYLKSE